MITERSCQPTGSVALRPEQQKWLAEVYEKNYASVYRLCSSILGNPEDAADVSQEVFLVAVDSLSQPAGSAAARAWLLTVARNRCLDLLRRRRRSIKALVTLQTELSDSIDVETAVADRDLVGRLFTQLSSRERQALWQSAVEHRSLTEIAAGLRLSYDAAAQMVHRARVHASRLASRIAMVFGLIQLGRVRRLGSLGNAERLAALAAVPLIAVAIQSSSPLAQALPPASSSASSHRHASYATIRGGNGTIANSAQGAGSGALPTATGGVGQLLRSLATGLGTTAQLSAVPSLPPVALPNPIPTLSPIPVLSPFPTISPIPTLSPIPPISPIPTPPVIP